MMKKLYILTLLVLTPMIFGGVAARAQTPDGETPAIEEACSLEVGAAFGLCNAYCEAMDCHLDRDGDPAPSASQTACDRVAIKFMNITGRELPCDSCEFATDPDQCCIDTPDDPFCDEPPTGICDADVLGLDELEACCLVDTLDSLDCGGGPVD